MKDATRISRSKKENQMRVNNNSKRERERGNRRRGIRTISILRTLKLAHRQSLCAFYYNALQLVVINYFKVAHVSALYITNIKVARV